MHPLTTKPATWQLGGTAGSGRGTAGVVSTLDNSSTSEPFCNQRGQVVGTLKGGWLEKSVDCSKHQLRVPPSWAIDAEHLRRLRALGANGVRLNDEQGRTWEATLEQFETYAIRLDRGHGLQVALPLAKWAVKDARQMSLWGDL